MPPVIGANEPIESDAGTELITWTIRWMNTSSVLNHRLMNITNIELFM